MCVAELLNVYEVVPEVFGFFVHGGTRVFFFFFSSKYPYKHHIFLLLLYQQQWYFFLHIRPAHTYIFYSQYHILYFVGLHAILPIMLYVVPEIHEPTGYVWNVLCSPHTHSGIVEHGGKMMSFLLVYVCLDETCWLRSGVTKCRSSLALGLVRMYVCIWMKLTDWSVQKWRNVVHDPHFWLVRIWMKLADVVQKYEPE